MVKATSLEEIEESNRYLKEIPLLTEAIQEKLSEQKIKKQETISGGEENLGFSNRRDRLSAYLTTLRESLASFREFEVEASQLLEDYEKPAIIAIMGEFNAGKSTFINAFLGEKVLPTGVLPTTATINVLKFGDKRSCRLVWIDGSTEEVEFRELHRFVAEGKEKADNQLIRRIRLVEIRLPEPILKEVWLIDTPGLNAIIPEHRQVTRNFMKEADVTVWLFNATQFGKASERSFIEEAKRHSARVIGVLNHADKIKEIDELNEVVAEAKTKYQDLIQDVFPISAKNYLDLKLAQDVSNLPKTDFVTLLDHLNQNVFPHSRYFKKESALMKVSDLIGRVRQQHEEANGHLATLVETGEDIKMRLANQRKEILSGYMSSQIEKTMSAFNLALAEEINTLSEAIKHHREVTEFDVERFEKCLKKTFDDLLGGLGSELIAKLESVRKAVFSRWNVVLSRVSNQELNRQMELFKQNAQSSKNEIKWCLDTLIQYCCGLVDGGLIKLFIPVKFKDGWQAQMLEKSRERFSFLSHSIENRIKRPVEAFFTGIENFCDLSKDRFKQQMIDQSQTVYSPIFELEKKLKTVVEADKSKPF